MLKACHYCGRIHSKKMDCMPKIKLMRERDAVQREREDEIRSFRSSGTWRKKAEAIRSRDKGLCLVCRAELSRFGKCTGTLIGAEVHHIVPLAKDFELRLEDDNLITLCRKHHEEAEAEELSREFLQGLVEVYSE